MGAPVGWTDPDVTFPSPPAGSTEHGKDGVPRVTTRTTNRARRLSALGNGVVPQCAELIGLRILQLEEAA